MNAHLWLTPEVTRGHKSRLLERGDRRSRHAAVGLGLLMWLLLVLVRVCLEESFVCTKGAKSRLLRRNQRFHVGRLETVGVIVVVVSLAETRVVVETPGK